GGRPGDGHRPPGAAQRRAGEGAGRRPERRARAWRGVHVVSAPYDWLAQLADRGTLPDVFHYAFFVRGLLSVLLLAPLLGGMSHLVVARRLSFFSAALGQAALTGLTIGLVLLGEPLHGGYGGSFGF